MIEVLKDIRETYGQFDMPLFQISGTTITVATLITFVIVVIVTFALAGLMQRAVVRAFSKDGQRDQGTTAVVSRLVRYLILIGGLGIGIDSLGINLTGLFAAGAVFAVAIGFAMQNISQNFVSGVILLLERAIKPGDILEVEGRLVRVLDMGIRATIARSLDEEDIIIPNSTLVASPVKNYTLRDSLYRLRSQVGVVYSSDMAQVRRVLEEAAGKMEWRSPQQAPRILLTDFGDSSVNFEVSVWIEDPWQMRQLLNLLNEAVWWGLKDAGITIAFPQLDVHFDRELAPSLGTGPRAI
ncbi:MAG: mechanosensitive ion channel domain-containing protein [Thermoanaerobaculia bacterium]